MARLVRRDEGHRGRVNVTLVISAALAGTALTMAYAESSAEDGRITESEIVEAQQTWGTAIVEIGEAYTAGKDYRAVAERTVDTLYGYAEGPVLFKPTKASEKQFRLTREEAVSYFVTGSVAEDHGFAIQPWSAVRFENAGLVIDGDSAIAMATTTSPTRTPEPKRRWSSPSATSGTGRASCASTSITPRSPTNRRSELRPPAGQRRKQGNASASASGWTMRRASPPSSSSCHWTCTPSRARWAPARGSPRGYTLNGPSTVSVSRAKS